MRHSPACIVVQLVDAVHHRLHLALSAVLANAKFLTLRHDLNQLLQMKHPSSNRSTPVLHVRDAQAQTRCAHRWIFLVLAQIELCFHLIQEVASV